MAQRAADRLTGLVERYKGFQTRVVQRAMNRIVRSLTALEAKGLVDTEDVISELSRQLWA